MTKSILTAVSILLIGYSTMGQQTAPSNTTSNIDYNNVKMPEAPNSEAFSRFGNTEVNTATGVPNISIPLYTLEVDGVSVPIALSYDATGIKVNQLATAVGLNWTLSADGGVYRTVRSKADDDDGWLDSGFTYLPDSHYDNFDPDDPDWQEDMIGNGPDFDNGFARIRDHNPDLFSYSIPGHSGSFILPPDGQEVFKTKEDGLVLNISGSYTSISVGTIEDNNGNIYHFSGYEETSNDRYTYGSITSNGGGGIYNYDDYEWNETVTGWKLSSIVTKNGRVIEFDYELYDMGQYQLENVDKYLTRSKPCNQSPPVGFMTKQTTVDAYHHYKNQLIKKISSDNIEITFHYSTQSNLSHWKRRLDSITVLDKAAPLVEANSKSFRFVYSSYPGDPRLRLEQVTEVGNDGVTEKPAYEFDYNDNYPLPQKNSYAQDFYGFYNHETDNDGLVHINSITKGAFGNDQGFVENEGGYRNLNQAALESGILEKITYPTGGNTEFDFEANEDGNGKYMGGLRVKAIMDNTEGETYNRRNYQYIGLRGQDIESLYGDGAIKDEGNSTVINSSITLPLGGVAYPYRSGYFYDKVTVVHTDGSEQFKEEHYFEDNHYSSMSLDPLLKERRYYRGTGTTVLKREEYTYGIQGSEETLEWNVLGDMVCYSALGNVKLGYGMGKGVRMNGNYAILPVRVATTEYLKEGVALRPVTTVTYTSYDDQTLLPIERVIDYRRTRTVLSGGIIEYQVTHPDGEMITTTTYYPSDTGDPGAGNWPRGLPIKSERESLRHGAITHGQCFEYDIDGNIKRTYSYNRGATSNNWNSDYIDDDYQRMANFLFENGKPVQVMPEDGIPTSYIWGYNHTLPVAKIEGKARYSLDSQLVGDIESTTDEAQLLGLLDTLRNDPSLSSAMVTTFTHKILAGVSTITDPKGDTLTYHYDALNRLSYVTDAQGHIVSEKEYRYAPQ